MVAASGAVMTTCAGSTEWGGTTAMASTRSAVRCGGSQHGGERWRLPRGRWQRLPTKAVKTPVLLKAHGAGQRDGMWGVTCPTVSVRRARAEETATD
jgi:hypothetical protein